MDQPRIPLSSIDDDIAREKGRLMAAQVIAQNSDKRKQMEEIFGRDYIRRRFPEAYTPSPFFKRVIDKIKSIRL